jgi:hypothetical protein
MVSKQLILFMPILFLKLLKVLDLKKQIGPGVNDRTQHGKIAQLQAMQLLIFLEWLLPHTIPQTLPFRLLKLKYLMQIST